MPSEAPLPALVVLISGRGRNLRAIIQAHQRGELRADIRAVISNRRNAAGLEYARAAGIPTEILASTKTSDRESYDLKLAELIEHFKPDVVALAGFMRILSSAFVQRFSGRLVNIHPSLLPRHRGLDTHNKALAAGDERHGASVHFVTEELDAGPVILQGSLPVLRDDTPQTLAERLMERVETRIYPQALEWVLSGHVRLHAGRVAFDGQAQEVPRHEKFDRQTNSN